MKQKYVIMRKIKGELYHKMAFIIVLNGINGPEIDYSDPSYVKCITSHVASFFPCKYS